MLFERHHENARLAGRMLPDDSAVPEMDAGSGSVPCAFGIGAEGIDQQHVMAAERRLTGVFLPDGPVSFRGGIIAPDGP